MVRGGRFPLKIAGAFPKIFSILLLRVTTNFIGIIHSFVHRIFLLLTGSGVWQSYVIELGCQKNRIFMF